MRKIRSVVALASVAAVMACQTAVASTSAIRDSQVVPVVSAQQTVPSGNTVATAKADVAQPAVAAEGTSHKKLWIAVAIAAVIVAVVLIAGGSGGSSYGY